MRTGETINVEIGYVSQAAWEKVWNKITMGVMGDVKGYIGMQCTIIHLTRRDCHAGGLIYFGTKAR